MEDEKNNTQNKKINDPENKNQESIDGLAWDQVFSNPMLQQKVDFQQSLDITAQCVKQILNTRNSSTIYQKIEDRLEDLINRKIKEKNT